MATYAQLATLRNSSAFRDRVELAVVFYARYIISEDPATPLHNVRANWAKNAFQNPSGVSNGLLNAVALDGTIGNVLDAATDGQVQSATEAVINTILSF